MIFPFVSKRQGPTSFGGKMLYIAPEIVIPIKLLHDKKDTRKKFLKKEMSKAQNKLVQIHQSLRFQKLFPETL